MGEERALVTVRKVTEIVPINGADFIEIAQIDGWKVIVKKGEFKINQKVLFYEIDSFLPEKPQYEFLRKSSFKVFNGVNGFRLRTMKMRGVVSQGLILPLSDFKLSDKIAVGTDLTSKLGVILYDPFLNQNSGVSKAKGMKGLFYRIRNMVVKKFPKTLVVFNAIDKKIFKTKMLKPFPNFCQKTECTRIQNVRDIDKIRNVSFEVTTKIDGSSLTIYKKGKHIGVCSRNIEVTGQDDNYNKIDEKYGISKALEQYPVNIAIQGEMFGEGINGNNEEIKGIDFRVFSIYDIDEQRYFTPEDRLQVLEDLKIIDCNLKHVPILNNNFKIGDKTVDEVISMADGESMFGKMREGIVLKSNELINGNILIIKCISNKYLIKKGL